MKLKIHCVTLLSVLLFSLVFAACDSGLKYVKMEVSNLPDQTIYYIGEDSFLRFDGGAVCLTIADGRTYIEDMRSYTYQEPSSEDDFVRYIYSDVNFYIAGTYTVTIYQTEDLYCQYEVTVKEK
jgi:hypothetical protein